jgi:FkbM family methyltransferase
LAGARLINDGWGPRDFTSALGRIVDTGVKLEQIVDVGASDGTWTRKCLGVLPQADYFLVDPLIENQSSLETLCAESSNVSFWSGALGQATGVLDLFVHGDQSSFMPSQFGVGGQDAREVEIRTLDSFLETGRLQPPSFIKADVQGFEVEVLKGARRCLESTELLLLEVSFQCVYDKAPLAHEVISFVAEQGFQIYDICSYIQRTRDGVLMQSDLLFAKCNSALFKDGRWS